MKIARGFHLDEKVIGISCISECGIQLVIHLVIYIQLTLQVLAVVPGDTGFDKADGDQIEDKLLHWPVSGFQVQVQQGIFHRAALYLFSELTEHGIAVFKHVVLVIAAM